MEGIISNFFLELRNQNKQAIELYKELNQEYE